MLENYPALVRVIHLDKVLGYYAYKAYYLPDPDLVFREKPFNRRIIDNFTGAGYSPRYGIEVQPYRIEWIMDKDGFRNGRAAISADVVVLGDSYIEYGATEADTFTGRLEAKLPHLSVRNLGKSGYSVGQYVHVLERYGLPYKPKIALMAFYEGNDVQEIGDYLLWKSGRLSEVSGYLLKFATDSLWRRYAAAVGATTVELQKTDAANDDAVLGKLAMTRGYARRIHPAVAILNLKGGVTPKVFIDRIPEMTVNQMLATEELQAIRDFFNEFREVCQTNGIAPLILYIPTALQVYAPYTARASGSQWLAIRERQTAVRRNTELAIKSLAQETGIELISLTQAFEAAAAEGELVYYAVDPHWNARGREIAARFVAGVLKKKSLLSQRDKQA